MSSRAGAVGVPLGAHPHGAGLGDLLRSLGGNGAVVDGDVPDGQMVPAGTVWPPRP